MEFRLIDEATPCIGNRERVCDFRHSLYGHRKYRCVSNKECSAFFTVLPFAPPPLPRVQTGVSGLLRRVLIRRICQEATLPPLLPQWMYSALAGAGKSREWKLPVMEGCERISLGLFLDFQFTFSTNCTFRILFLYHAKVHILLCLLHFSAVPLLSVSYRLWS